MWVMQRRHKANLARQVSQLAGTWVGNIVDFHHGFRMRFEKGAWWKEGSCRILKWDRLPVGRTVAPAGCDHLRLWFNIKGFSIKVSATTIHPISFSFLALSLDWIQRRFWSPTDPCPIDRARSSRFRLFRGPRSGARRRGRALPPSRSGRSRRRCGASAS